MKKIILGILVAFGFVAAQQPNQYSVSSVHFTVTNFAYDSVRMTNWFPVSDLENIAAIISTTTKDSAHFYYCWQRGYRNENDTIVWKRPSMVIDTFNTTSASSFQAPGNIIAAPDSDLAKAIDSTQLGSSVVSQIEQFSPKWSPVARIWFKGLASNKHTLYNILVTINQRKYLPVSTTQK